MNTPPQIASLEILPLDAFTDTSLTASLESGDEDGDSLESRYEWYLNGVKVPGETSSSLSADHFLKGDRVKVVATVSDATAEAVAEAVVEIQNSAPVVEISAAKPIATNRTATLSGSARDHDDEPLTYRWTQLSGEPVILESPDKPITTFTTPRVFGALAFQLTVTDSEGLASSKDIVVEVKNSPPSIHTISLAPQPAYTNVALTATVEASDPDSQPLTNSFRWYVNDLEIPGATTATLSHKHFQKNDQVRVEVEVTDGAMKVSASESISISDSPATLSVFGVPETALYGVPTRFTVSADDPDDDQFDIHFTTRPNGMEINNDGVVSWTPVGPMFDTFQDVNWEIVLKQAGEITTVGGTIRVLDEDRLPPIARSGIVFSYNSEKSIASGDFSGKGTLELLVTDRQNRLYTLAYDGNGYVQNWMYPYVLASEDGRINCVAAGDIDGDGRDEMLVGLTTYTDAEPATRILIIDGQSRRLRDVIDLSGETVVAIRVNEVDNDGWPEIITLLNVEGSDFGEYRLLVYNGENLGPAWRSPALALQTDLAVGDTDGDGTREIVLSGGYVFGYDGTSYVNEWLLADGFGDHIDVADLNADGDDEIVGRLYNNDREIAVFAVGSDTPIAKTGKNISDIFIADLDDDGKSEIVAFPYLDTTLHVYSFDQDATTPLTVDWSISLRGRALEGLVADVDGDQELEVIAITAHSSQLVVVGRNPEPEIEWLNDSVSEIAQYYLDIGQANFNGAGNRTVFLANATSRAPEFSSGMRAVQMNPRTGTLKWSRSLTGIGNNGLSGVLSDQGKDGTIEFLYADGETPAMYSFFSDSVVWQAPEMNADIKTIAAGDLNGDGSEDFVAATDTGNINAYDPKNQVLLWGIDRNSIKNIIIDDLDGDQRDELLLNDYDSVSVYLPDDDGANLQYTQTAEDVATAMVAMGLLDAEAGQRLNGEFRTMTTGDLDHDGKLEVVLSSSYSPGHSWLIILNHDLTPHSVTLTDGIVGGMRVQNYGTGHRNILALFPVNYYSSSRAVFREIDPYSGNVVSSSPTILPVSKFNNAFHFVDTNDDGIPELSYGTNFSINVTR